MDKACSFFNRIPLFTQLIVAGNGRHVQRAEYSRSATVPVQRGHLLFTSISAAGGRIDDLIGMPPHVYDQLILDRGWTFGVETYPSIPGLAVEHDDIMEHPCCDFDTVYEGGEYAGHGNTFGSARGPSIMRQQRLRQTTGSG